MKFTSEAFLINFNKVVWKKALDDEMMETTVEAAIKWLTVVTVLIPTWSRASLATFSELASSVGFPIPYGPMVAFQDRTDLGTETSTGGLLIESLRSWHFYYETDLFYLAWNDFNHAVKGDGSGVYSQLLNPGPYRFQQAGENEFRSFAEQVKLPDPLAYISGKKI